MPLVLWVIGGAIVGSFGIGAIVGYKAGGTVDEFDGAIIGAAVVTVYLLIIKK